jgi:hypothetical protein
MFGRSNSQRAEDRYPPSRFHIPDVRPQDGTKTASSVIKGKSAPTKADYNSNYKILKVIIGDGENELPAAVASSLAAGSVDLSKQVSRSHGTIQRENYNTDFSRSDFSQEIYAMLLSPLADRTVHTLCASGGPLRHPMCLYSRAHITSKLLGCSMQYASRSNELTY